MDDENEVLKYVRGAQQGDAEAFGWLYRKYYPYILAICFRHGVSDHNTAEDLTQDTFIKIAKRISTFDARGKTGKFSWWISRIAVNTCRDHFRKLSRRNEKPIDEHEESLHDSRDDDQPSTFIRTKVSNYLVEQIDALTAYPDRAFCVAHYCQLIPVAAIAKLYNETINHVYYILSRAVKKLKAQISKRFAKIDLSNLGIDWS